MSLEQPAMLTVATAVVSNLVSNVGVPLTIATLLAGGLLLSILPAP